MPNTRGLVPWVGAIVALVGLWPTVCMSSETGPTTCQNAIFLPLPWGESADIWGMGTAAGVAILTFFLLQGLRRSAAKTP